MKYVLLLLIVIFSISCIRKFDCKESSNKNVKLVTFELSSYMKGDSFKLTLDDGRFEWKSKELSHDFVTNYNNKRYYIVKNYCTVEDSIKICFSCNNNSDTIFNIKPSKVSTCFLSLDLKNRYRVSFIYNDTLNIIKIE